MSKWKVGVGREDQENTRNRWSQTSYLGLARTIYMVYIRYFWQGIHQIYGLMSYVICGVYIYTVLANPIYTVYIRYFWQGIHQIYGHIRCIYTILANPSHIRRHNS